MTTTRDPGDLSRLLVDLARVPRLALPDAVVEALPAGTVVGRFVIEREIGRGGFGIVYAAKDPELGRLVALKILHPGIGLARGETDWIRREAEAVARLAHPAIVTLFDAGQSEAGAFLVFELLQGESLAERMAKGPVGPEEALRIATAVAGALEHAHAAGILHRDLKPGNVFLCASGAVKVLDFGIAQLFDREGPPSSGTRGYMAPEQQEGREEDARTDLFALGMVIRAMLGEAKTSRKVRDLLRLSEELADPDPDRRPRTAGAVREKLEAIGTKDARSARRRTLLAFAVIAALVGGALATWKASPPEAPPGERWVLSIAPTVNPTGMTELDHVDELVRAGLADSPRFRILARARVEAALGFRRTDPERPSLEAWRTAAAGLGARIVVVPEALADGSGYRIALLGLDARTGKEEFRAEALAASLAAVPQSLDTALLSFREKSRERAEDRARTFRPLASITSPSLVAFHHYQEGLACLSSPLEIGVNDEISRCGPFFRSALEDDPSFPLVHRVLAALVAGGDPNNREVARHIGEALASPDRLSRRDDVIVRALKDHVDRDDAAAFRRYAGLVAEDPGDVEATYMAGDLLFHSSRYDEAIPYLAKVVDLKERYPLAFDHVVESYGLTGKDAELARLLDSIDRPDPGRLRAVVSGEAWLGRYDRALAIVRDPRWGNQEKATQHLLVQTLSRAGQLDEAAALARSMVEQDPDDVLAYIDRLMIALKQGRAREAWKLLGSPPRDLQKPRNPEWLLGKATVAAAERNLPVLRSSFRRLCDVGPEYAPYVAVQLALLGSPADIAAMHDCVRERSVAGREIDAIGMWKAGDQAGAMHALTMLEREVPRPDAALSPDYLLAEVALETEPAEALLAANRYRKRLPKGIAAGWTVSRSILVSAEAAWRIGRREEALAFIAQGEKLLANADPGFPTAVEMTRLRKAIESGAPPKAGVHFGPRVVRASAPGSGEGK